MKHAGNTGVMAALAAAALFGAGSAVLSWPTQHPADSFGWSAVWPALAVLGACLAWGVDNNLTRKVSLLDASYVAMVKGLVAGSTNLVLALVQGARLPAFPAVLAAGILGFAAYGASLVLFVVALRHLGTARTGAYFSVAPFFGAAFAVGLLGDAVTVQLLTAGGLMAAGVTLHLTERQARLHCPYPRTLPRRSSPAYALRLKWQSCLRGQSAAFNGVNCIYRFNKGSIHGNCEKTGREKSGPEEARRQDSP